MARQDRHKARGRAAGHKVQQGPRPELDESQRVRVDALLADLPALAQALREGAAQGREGIVEALSPVSILAEAGALTLAMRLGDVRGAHGRDAADVAQAVGELDPRREVAREARRSRIRLRSIGAPASLVIPPLPTPATAQAAQATGPSGAQSQPAPRLVEAYATRTRERGEVVLVLGWQEGLDANYVRGYTLELSFWNDGVREFALLEPMRRARFLEETVEALRAEQMELVPVTWAQARRLVLEALDVNAWHGTSPAADFRRYQAQVQSRLLAVPESDERRAEIDEEERRFERDGNRYLIGADIEPDELVVHYLGAWSFGDFSLTYDLLADDHPQRQRQSRADYVESRRAWWKEAEPRGLRMTLVREQEKRASALWVPGAQGIVGAGQRKDFEAFWSLILREVESAGQLEDVPMGTLVSRETGRHWFWTGYTLARDTRWGLWLVSRSRDEGAASQALPIEELQRRIQEARKTVEDVTSKPAPDPTSDEATGALRAITGALTSALHYSDALTVRLPLDESAYREAANDARALANHERAAAILEKMRGRFADDTRVGYELGVEQYLTAEQYGRQGQAETRDEWLARAVATMTAVVDADRTGEHVQALGELLAQQGHYRQAAERLREAAALAPDRALIYSDLADALMGQITGEDVDAPRPPTEQERRDIARQALDTLREASRRDGSIPGIFTRMGAIYDILGQPEDALLALEEAVRRDQRDGEAWYALGSMRLQRGQPEQAARALETALQINPYGIPYHLALAAAYGTLGRTAEARRELDAVDRLQPGLPQVAELRSALAREGKRR